MAPLLEKKLKENRKVIDQCWSQRNPSGAASDTRKDKPSHRPGKAGFQKAALAGCPPWRVISCSSHTFWVGSRGAVSLRE